MSAEKTKILLVDDEPDILEFMSYNLNKEGFEVFTSTNGKDAIRIATQEKPSLIILDVMHKSPRGRYNNVRDSCQLLRLFHHVHASNYHRYPKVQVISCEYLELFHYLEC